jgi:hypothetical protein
MGLNKYHQIETTIEIEDKIIIKQNATNMCSSYRYYKQTEKA